MSRAQHVVSGSTEGKGQKQDCAFSPSLGFSEHGKAVIADARGLLLPELGDRNLLRGALGAQQPPAVTASDKTEKLAHTLTSKSKHDPTHQ